MGGRLFCFVFFMGGSSDGEIGVGIGGRVIVGDLILER